MKDFKPTLFEIAVISLIVGVTFASIYHTLMTYVEDPVNTAPEEELWPGIPDHESYHEEEEYGTFPKLQEPRMLPQVDHLEPHLTWDDVDERIEVIRLTQKLGKGDKTTSVMGNTYQLIVSNSRISASTFHKRWVQSAKRAGIDLKGKNLWVTVVGNNSYVERTHHCTRNGAH